MTKTTRTQALEEVAKHAAALHATFAQPDDEMSHDTFVDVRDALGKSLSALARLAPPEAPPHREQIDVLLSEYLPDATARHLPSVSLEEVRTLIVKRLEKPAQPSDWHAGYVNALQNMLVELDVIASRAVEAAPSWVERNLTQMRNAYEVYAPSTFHCDGLRADHVVATLNAALFLISKTQPPSVSPERRALVERLEQEATTFGHIASGGNPTLSKGE